MNFAIFQSFACLRHGFLWQNRLCLQIAGFQSGVYTGYVYKDHFKVDMLLTWHTIFVLWWDIHNNTIANLSNI